MINNPNYTIKDTNSAKVQIKLRGFGQQRLKEQNTLSPPTYPSHTTLYWKVDKSQYSKPQVKTLKTLTSSLILQPLYFTHYKDS